MQIHCLDFQKRTTRNRYVSIDEHPTSCACEDCRDLTYEQAFWSIRVYRLSALGFSVRTFNFYLCCQPADMLSRSTARVMSNLDSFQIQTGSSSKKCYVFSENSCRVFGQSMMRDVWVHSVLDYRYVAFVICSAVHRITVVSIQGSVRRILVYRLQQRW